jgi:hypothetical protein
MKIFGIGLSRTGTKSLTKALNSLGFNIIHYPIDEVTHKQLQAGNYKLSILDNCDGITDLTVVPYYAQLDSLFPNSKFILTIRNKEDWLASMKNHWAEKVDDKTKPEYELKMNIRYFLRAAVYGCQRYSFDRLSYVYDLHYRNVLEYFRNKKDSLLIIDINNGDGWEKLCPFLGLEIPQIEFPFVKFKKQM